MSVATYSDGDLFIMRVIKSHVNNPMLKWANSYEFRAAAAGSEDELLTLGTELVNFEAAIHLNIVNFDRLIISTWVRDSKPYNPDSFISTSLSAVGTQAHAAEAVALNQCLVVTRQCATGRFGHIFYRGVLEEGTVSAPAGSPTLTNKAGNQATIDTALTSTGLFNAVGVGATGPFRLVLVGLTADTARNVIGLRAQGVTSLPLQHAWFNRTVLTSP
jgi:hypothetical protein